MKNLSKLTFMSLMIAATMALAGQATAADGFSQIKTEADFRKLVVGKRLTIDDNYFTIKKNGTISGKFRGETLKGNWAWRDQYWCRTLTTHSKNTDCQLWTINGKQHQVTRGRGKGRSFTYEAK